MKIFLICPVREITETEKTEIENYIEKLENGGHSVHLPFRDTDQDDLVGLRICTDNKNVIESADEIHIWWNDKSQGSLFDFGMAFMANKRIVLANADFVTPTPNKSFKNVLLALNEK